MTVRPNSLQARDVAAFLHPYTNLKAHEGAGPLVIKRGRGTGFSGVENPLFLLDNTRMLFGDGQKAVNELIQAVKEL